LPFIIYTPMLFNSVGFAIFLPIVFLLYWFVTNKNLKLQNILLLVSSYYFYACWDWRFMFLLIFSTLLDYYTGYKMCETENRKTKAFWFWLSIVINLGFLGVFKYYNFFASSFAEAAAGLGFQTNPVLLEILLPVGISFYTFHGLSYVIDIYKGRIKAERNFIDYAVFVSFFPLLVAGPIERATHLLPQIKAPRFFNYEKAKDGLRQILWGLFKKIVIADQCAEMANTIFNNSDDMSGSSLFLGALFFTFQIYGDFSGYSDIALGTARLFGIELLRNFSYPYFSRDIAEFLEKVAHLTVKLVQGLFIHTSGRQQRRYLDESKEYFYNLSGQRFLAWRQLDIYCLGCVERHLLFTVIAHKKQQAELRNCS
jgi:alginate O-acetyltransferase complex protein AlgI